ncbi:rho GTPase-activating protein 23 isoform X3 [Denticeps clupeoides]|uniref:rho GTPase-activating protein 23 isoform X3 n=1 Tax=Denticeps clupeoides TaxID=299321 RepID=UPI0010A40F41|nr:rho GTPase-activating protein 23-like isoform X3 [Denticeps clupeoides]
MNGVAFCLVGIPPHAQTQAKGRRDGISTSNEKVRPLSGTGVACQGPRTVVLQKNSQGFGFTLRHFIVYPPESALHANLKDEENGNGKGCQRSRLEPMDTIFVKSVRDKGPAHQAGLSTGDRLVKVNGESVLGKTYSQVIALIQNSDSALELSIMPKDEDVLQLVSAYSQDAYLRGNDPFTGDAQNLPDPPPLCYPARRPSAPAIPSFTHGENLNCHSSPPLDNRTTSSVPPGGLEGNAGGRHIQGHARGRSASSVGLSLSPLDFHFANHNAAIASASLPPPRKGSLPQARSELCHQALSDWYYSQAERPGLSMSPRHRSISQDRLAELGLALGHHRGTCVAGWPNSASQDTLLLHHGSSMGGWGIPSGGSASRSCSENLLAAYASYEQNYGRSLDVLDQAATLVSPRYEHLTRAPHSQQTRSEVRVGPTNHRATVSATVPPHGRTSQSRQQQPAQARRFPDDQTVGYRSYSPSFCRKAGHLLQQSHSFRDPSYKGPQLSWTPTPKTSPPEATTSSSPSPSTTADSQEMARRGSGASGQHEELSPAPLQEVVLRQKPNVSRRTPHGPRHSQYTLPAEAADSPSGTSPAPPNGSLPPVPVEQDSLASIPFIDEPASPSADESARHVPASSVVSGVQCPPAPAPPSLTSPLTQLLSTDSSNIKNSRRSSYLLAIMTERSKSCDEGLNVFREEGRVFSRLPKRVKSFFTDGSLESLRAAEDARSKRHSTSELGNITLTDVRKEGWLHYKQILTEKGKKVGGGMRPWKRVFCVLRSHSLFLYKDKREAVLHGAGGHGHTHGDDEQPISIRGCLIDIAYSETKRKHTLRLTTQDFCEYLLQAEDREDMLGWIRVIRENGKTDSEDLGFSRQALINKKLNDCRKQSPTGNKPDTSPRVHRMMPPFLLSKMDSPAGITRSPKTEGKDENSSPKTPWSINIMKKAKKGSPKAFGVRLEDCQPGADKFVPLIVEICCSLVEAMGLEYTGVYRVPGNNAMVSSLQEQLNKGMEINTTEEKWQDLNVISSLLKSFFRKLPEPLFTDDKYGDFIDANRLEDTGERLKTMRKLVHDLPDHYYHTLKYLVGHLKRVADNSDKNKMEPRNLALVFGPTLVRTSEDNMTDMVTHMPDRYKIIETLILHYCWFFSDEMDKDEKTPEDQKDVQPVPNIDHLLSNIGRTGPLGDTPDSTNNGPVKPKESLGSKKDLSAKDFLPRSIMSAVTRKRKKRQSACRPGNSTDEDSEHEPVKASNYGGNSRAEEGNDEEDGDDEDEEVEGNEGRVIHRSELGDAEGECGSERKKLDGGNTGGQEAGKVGEGGKGMGEEEEGGVRRVQPIHVPRSFLYSHHHATTAAQTNSTPPSAHSCQAEKAPTQTGPLTRKKLRGEKAHPHSMYLQQDENRNNDWPPNAEASKTKAALIHGQEKLRTGQPGSPESRRRRRDWRRHTVVVGPSGDG